MKKVAILQSNYIPWKGYFDIINMVDEFILFDSVQYTKGDWRNRNKIKTAQGTQWLTIPVNQKTLTQKINETQTSNNIWRKKHWNTIKQSYSKSSYFSLYSELFESLYLGCDESNLSKINLSFITQICNLLGIDTKISLSDEFDLAEGQTKKLLGICRDCNADVYVSGPSAKSYFDEELAKKEGIEIEWVSYSNYREYKQLYPPFEHNVSILDLIFNEGTNAKKFMTSFI